MSHQISLRQRLPLWARSLLTIFGSTTSYNFLQVQSPPSCCGCNWTLLDSSASASSMSDDRWLAVVTVNGDLIQSYFSGAVSSRKYLLKCSRRACRWVVIDFFTELTLRSFSSNAPFTPALFPVHTAAAARHSSGMRFTSSSKILSVQRQELWSYDAPSLTSRRAGNLTLTIRSLSLVIVESRQMFCLLL